MKITQMFALLAVVVGLCGGAAFLSQWARSSATTTRGAAAENVDHGLYFPIETVTLRDEVEVHNPGKCDFAFENRTGKRVDVGLDRKGCTCEWVELAVLDEGQKLDPWPPDINRRGGADAVVSKGITWQRLDEGVVLSVPAGARGFARLGWDTKEVHAVRLRAAVWCRREDDPNKDVRDLTYLGVLANVVDAIQVYPKQIEVPPLNLGGSAVVECWCWSATRDDFPLQARLENPNPCIQCKVERLSAAERDALVQRDRDKRRLEEWTHVRCGYHVTVEFHEQVGKSQLDLGYFEQALLFDGGAEGVATRAYLAWTVRGSIHVLADKPEDQDILVLGKFPSAEGVSRDFSVQSSDPGLELALEESQPSYLHVLFAKESTPEDVVGRWRLSVRVPPNVVSGRFGGKGYVLLKILGPTPRHVRIPIYGTAYRER
jgi:hypothetical protein